MALLLSAASPRRRYSYAAVLALILLLGAGVSVWYSRASVTRGALPISGASGANEGGVGILLSLASSAVHDQRVVAPQGSNAYEFYLSVLQLDPGNVTATRYLHDLFEPACSDVELAVSRGSLNEAARELRLLRDYDGSNYKLSLLGGYLDAQRVLMTQKHEAQARRMQEHSSEAD